MPVPPFHPEAIERVMSHAERGHWIVLVSGTLEPLAKQAARVLEAELRARGWPGKVRVCATRLEEKQERWTGRIAGEAMFGEEKARAIRRFAAAIGIELPRCFAYGDSSSDWWMLEAVGRPAAVNPSGDLARIAGRNGWQVLRWNGGQILTQSSQSSQSSMKEHARAIRKKPRVAAARQGNWV